MPKLVEHKDANGVELKEGDVVHLTARVHDLVNVEGKNTNLEILNPDGSHDEPPYESITVPSGKCAVKAP